MSHGPVLVVDDDPDAVASLGVILEMEGHVVETAADGLEALARLGSGPLPCLVVLDLMMPRMNGWELRTRMLADPVLGGVPVLVVSGAADLRDEARALGAVAVFPKPVNVDRLLEVVRAYC